MRSFTVLLTLLFLVFSGSSYAQITSCDGIVTNVSCNGSNDGAIDLNPVGGQPPYTYSWNGPNAFVASSLTISDLPAGNYVVLVVDAAGETCTNTFVITQPNPISCDDNDCLTVDVYNPSICACENNPIAPPACDDGICENGFESFDVATCDCITFSEAVLGCTDPSDTNYNEIATCDDGSCSNIPLSCNGIVANLGCGGLNEGTVELNVVGGQPPYSYSWAGSNGYTATSEDIFGLDNGQYFITVTDVNGETCSNSFWITTPTSTSCDTAYIDIIQVSTGDQIQVDFVVSNFNDIILMEYVIKYDPTILQFESGNLSSELEDVAFADFNIFNNSEPGDINLLYGGDSAADGLVLPDGTVLYSIFFTPLLTADSEVFVSPGSSEDITPYALTSDGDVYLEFSSGSILVGGNLISGSIYHDENDNCQNEEEQGLSFWPVKITDGNTVRNVITNSEGIYKVVLEDGTYDIEVTPINENWNLCNNNITVEVTGSVVQDFGAVALVDCAVMEVDIAIPILIRCFENDIYVDYCNYGTNRATDAFVEIELDPEMTFVDSEITPTSINGNLLTFDLGAVEIFECGDFSMTVLVDDNCDSSVLGQTHCTTATIFPNDSCEQADPLWDGSSLEVTGNCDGANVIFVIENIGTESMTQASSFIVIEDQVMGQTIPEDFMLAAGETYTITEPANGSTYYLSVDQVANHPGNSNPSIAIEGCGRNSNGEFSLGIVTQYNQDDNDGFVDIECVENVGSYDPNDKAAMLKGFGAENNIYANTPMEYMIRFQNTGTFTAFNVVVEDELSPNFDITSLRPGASSHDYTFSIEDERKLVFTFENINLPDSTADLAGSNGFLTYKVNQLLDLEDGTVLENTADIFFDFNEAIVTNTTTHTIGSDFIALSTFVDNQLGQENSISIFPNPATDKITFELEKISENLELEVYDLTGRLIYNKAFDQEKIILSKDGLTEGIYFYSIKQNSKQLTFGKFIFL